MIFNSLTFALFFVFVLAGMAMIRSLKTRNVFLLLTSAFFYGVWDWRFLGLLAFSSVFNFICGKRIHTAVSPWKGRWMFFNVLVNLAILGFFKYYNFFADTVNHMGHGVGVSHVLPLLQIILPLAISFYTFHCLSYTIDIYRGRIQPTENLLDFSLYLLFFPHLVAGPIVRAAALLPQIAEFRRPTSRDWSEGIFLIFWGLYKKVVVADNLAPKVGKLFALDYANASDVATGVLAFTFQIYADFSGYTDIARGAAQLLGFHFDLNFRFPYLADSPQDFWRRWHISLSQWLRDYLYVSLGGNRKGTLATYRNLMLTMVIGGLWHGAAWNFVIWGAYHGTLLCVHRAYDIRLKSAPSWLQSLRSSWLWGVAAVAIMFAFTCYGWLLFRATSVTQIGAFTGALLHPATLLSKATFAELGREGFYILPMILVEGVMAWRGISTVVLTRAWSNGLVYATLLYGIIFLGAYESEQFIYFTF